MEEKIKIIDEIVKRHPTSGVDKGWSWYRGGMEDTGDWYFRKMLDVSMEELQTFLDKLVADESFPTKVYTEQELIDIKTWHSYGGYWMSEYSRKQIEKFNRDRDNKLLGNV